jgi:patatin-like phospholipase/acyl hydrolase
MIRRILSIDGGGIKGVFPASFLAEVEDAIGESVASYFDLIVGTSTGGIIALGLGLGFSAEEILHFYEELGPTVFPRRSWHHRISQLLWARYDPTPLRQALQSQFGSRRLGESQKRLVIPSFNLETGEVYIYKTAHHPRFERDYKRLVVDVALATAAAPTFFPAHRAATGIPLVDGGMWANNPTGLAVVEGVGILGWPQESINVLSLGCTTSPLDVARGRTDPVGLFYWGLRIADVFMTAQSSGSMGTAAVLVGHESICRISPSVPGGRFGLDVTKEIPALKGLGHSEARKALPNLRPMFLTEPAEPFEPYRKLE